MPSSAGRRLEVLNPYSGAVVGTVPKASIDDVRMGRELTRINIRSNADVKSWFVCDEKQLRPAVAGAIINTDDNMHIEMTAPKEAFRPMLQSNAAWVESLVTKSRWGEDWSSPL